MRRHINRLMVFIRLVLMALMSFFLMLLLNSNNFFFHLSDLLLQLILLPNLPFDLLSILIFEQLLSSGKSLFLDLKPLLELFLVHNVVVGLLLINLVFLFLQTHLLVLNLLEQLLFLFQLLRFVLDHFVR